VTELRSHSTQALEGLEKGTEVRLCGILTGVARRRTKEGKAWASCQIEDLEGNLDAMVFPTAFESIGAKLEEDKAFLIKGKVFPEEGGPPKVSIQDLILLDEARVDFASLLSIRLRLAPEVAGERAAQLAELFARKPGKAQVRLRLDKPKDFSVTLDLSMKVKPDKEFKAEVVRICGPEAMEIMG
jgi:DNA polymerase III subunit alpha